MKKGSKNMITDNPNMPLLCGKSTDIKPTEGIQNGRGFIEMDTGEYYKFDLETKTWLKQ